MELTDRQVRGWLTNIYQPGALGADPVMRDVMRAHGRIAEGSDVVVSGDARALLKDMIDWALLPRPKAPDEVWQPHRVLVLSYLEGFSHHTVARLLHMSSRTLSREKTKAIRVLRTVLETPP